LTPFFSERIIFVEDGQRDEEKTEMIPDFHDGGGPVKREILPMDFNYCLARVSNG